MRKDLIPDDKPKSATGGNLRGRALHALCWSFLEQGGDRVIQFVVSIILARLLLPREFGLVAMLAVFISVARSFVDSGFGLSLIQKKEVTQEDASSVFYFNILLGVLMAGVLWLAAPLIAAFYDNPFLTRLTRALSLIIITGSFGIVQATLLRRRLDFKKQLVAQLTATLSSGVVGISMAYNGCGVWSIVGQQVTASVSRALTLWVVCGWRPSLVFSIASLRRMFTFSSRLLVVGIIDTIFQDIYVIVIGKLFSPTDLGYFGRAKGIQDLPVRQLSRSVKNVTFPLFSTIQDDKEHLKRVVRKALTGLVLINFPLMIGLTAVAQPLVMVLLTEKWAPCVPYLQLLSVVGFLYPLHLVNVDVLLAQGRSDLFLRVEIVKKTLTVAAIAITWRWGITALICGQIVQSSIAYYLNSYYTGKLLQYPFREQVTDVLPYLTAAVLMGAAVHAIRWLPLESYPILLTSQVVSGVILYVALCHALRLGAFREALSISKPYLRGLVGA